MNKRKVLFILLLVLMLFTAMSFNVNACRRYRKYRRYRRYRYRPRCRPPPCTPPPCPPPPCPPPPPPPPPEPEPDPEPEPVNETKATVKMPGLIVYTLIGFRGIPTTRSVNLPELGYSYFALVTVDPEGDTETFHIYVDVGKTTLIINLDQKYADVPITVTQSA